MLFIGVPRSGTRFVAKTLEANGIPCTHEKRAKVCVDYCGISYITEMTPIIELVRHPVNCISSLLERGVFRSWTRAFHGIHPALKPAPIDGMEKRKEAMWFWATWHRFVLPYKKYTVHIENVKEELEIVLQKEITLIENTFSYGNYTPHITWDDLSQDCRDIAKELGYEAPS